jgi:hypothetical protein
MRLPTPERYTLENVRKAVRDPSKLRNEVERLRRGVGKELFHRRFGHGTNPLREDWDNLIVLDACRYDVFEEVNPIRGEAEYIVSNGSHSKEFYEENVSGETRYDTVYVTANPYGAVMCSGVFFRMETTFSGETEQDSRGRISETTTADGRTLNFNHVENIDPAELVRTSLNVHESHPDKRLFVHFMQPHAPYIGERAASLRQSLEREEGLTFTAWTDLDGIDRDRAIGSLENAAKEGYISAGELRSVYVENLEIVLSHVEELVSELDGKTVVTADHGELLGEERAGHRFGHPEGLFVKELRVVPWLTITSGERRDVIAERPVESDDVTGSETNDQLELLGYR